MKKGALIFIFFMFLVGITDSLNAQEENVVENVLENIPYQEDGMGKRKLVDEKYALIMQAALRPGQRVPQHNANANVHLLILKGDVVVNLDGIDTRLKEGALFPVAHKTPMHVRNESQENASFLIIKTPNPSEMSTK